MKRIIAVVIIIITMFSMPIRSYAVPKVMVQNGLMAANPAIPRPGLVATRGDQISLQQYEQILSTLRRIKDYAARGNYDFCDTGIKCKSADEAKAVIQGFRELFLAEDEFFLYYNDRGYKKIYLEPQKNSNGKYSYWMCGEGGGSRGIYAVWKPGADTNERLRQHDEAKKVIDAFIAAAPQDTWEKLKYYNDVLAEHITYDLEGYQTGNTKHTPYEGLVEKRCVCSGYAESYFNLCYFSRISCAVADCISAYSVDGMPDHKIALVNVDGRWKEVDVTWNDTNTGVIYDYFMVDMDDTWQNHVNGTTPGPAGV